MDAQQLEQQKKRQAAEGIAALNGLAAPGSQGVAAPISSPKPAAGIAAPSDTGPLMIGGIPHQRLPDQKYPGPLSMLADGMAKTVGFIATAPFGNRIDEIRDKNRAELNSDNLPENERPKSKPLVAALAGIAAEPRQQPPIKTGFAHDGVITAESTKPVMEGGMQRSGGVFGIADVAGTNAIMARANAARQSIIDKETVNQNWQTQHGNADPERQRIAESNALLNRWNGEYQQQQTIADMARNPKVAQGIAHLAASAGHDAAAVRGQEIGQSNAMAANGIAARGQDIQAATEAKRIAGSPAEQQLKAAQAQGILATTENTQQLARLNSRYQAETDLTKKAALAEQIRVMSGKDKGQNFRAINAAGGSSVDPLGNVIKSPDSVVVFNEQTGEVRQIGNAVQAKAPASAIEFLKKNPQHAAAFKDKYGYLPEGF